MRSRGILLLLLCLSVIPIGQLAAQNLASDLFFSEYIEGSSLNKALEIYNGTGGAVDLGAGNYQIQVYFNGSTSAGTTIALSGSIAPGDVFVFAASAADAAILAEADQVSGSSLFNGDDAVALIHNGTIVDVIGQIGFDPGSEWGTGVVSTQNNTIRRKADICAGDTNPDDVFDPSIEWDGYAQDTFDGLGSHDTTCGGGPVDTPPQVTSTDPADGAVDVAADGNITVNFSEAVTLTGSWFDITCATSGSHSAVVTGGPQSYVLNPDVDLGASEGCTLTVFASQVTDQDGTPDNMAADFVATFTSGASFVCGDSATPIHNIQGDGASSPMVGSVVSVEGVVTGDYQLGGVELGGFFMQEEDADADANPLTSEGIFVYDNGFADVNSGDVVRLRGKVSEYYNLTELSSLDRLVVCGSGASVTAADLTLPVDSVSDFERYEGMLVHFPQTLTATDVYGLGRYGQVLLSADGRLRTPTNIVAPGAPANEQEDLNLRNQVILDDYNNQQNRDPILYPQPGGLTADNTLRDGYTLDNFTAVMDYEYGEYRLQPVAPVNFIAASNPRTSAPGDVGGLLKVAGFNVLNFFNGDGQGGGFPTSRGAETTFEFERQRAKIIHAIVAIDADVVGLTELENDGYGPDSAIQDLVNGLNEAIGSDTYAFIDPGVAKIGTDEISVGLIYKHTTVEPLGDPAILDSSVDPNFIDTLNRPALAQTFRQIATHGDFTAVINHLKSKGSDCNAVGDSDTGDGQGNCNVTRTKAATALVNWLATDPTNSGDPDFLIIGDLNSYAKEDPITALKAGGYTNLIESFVGEDAYSYVYFGEAGYLDHALANGSLTPQVTGATQWHINADEPPVLDYNTNYKSPDQVVTLYSEAPYRSSDHDPAVVGLNLEPTPIEVVIDIKPGSDENPINLKSKGVVPVAILSSADFDATLVDPTSITLAGAPVAQRGRNGSLFSYEDVNGDGLVDVLFQVETQALQLNEGDDSAALEGALLSGIPIVGSDVVRTVPGDGLQLVLPNNGANVTIGSSLFTWSAPAEAACYLIQIDDDSNFGSPEQEATVVGGSQYTSTALARGRYFWRVQVGGVCNIESGPWSEVWSFTAR